MIHILTSVVLAFASTAASFPSNANGYSLTARNTPSDPLAILAQAVVGPAPGPLAFTGTQLSNDDAHPFVPLQPGDIRGPCPALNTLASHGYIPHNGVAHVNQIVLAVQEGFNLGMDFAIFLAYNALLVDGNPLTGMLSIGSKSALTGPDPPPPALVGGIDVHNTFEGDASMTRNDLFLGNNFLFNQTLFDQFSQVCDEFGGGFYNVTSGGQLRALRIQQGIEQNPTFTFTVRIFSAFSESALPPTVFVDGRNPNKQCSLSNAFDFFGLHMFPDDFFRNPFPFTLKEVLVDMNTILDMHPILPGQNNGTAVNTYTEDPSLPTFNDLCGIYTGFLNGTIRTLYPNPTPFLKASLENIMATFFLPFEQFNCTQIFIYDM